MADILFPTYQIIIDNDDATLIFYPEQNIIHHCFHRNVAGQKFRDVLQAGAKILREQHASKWLSDERFNQLLPDDSNWAQEHWYPDVAKSGLWKFWALVVPPDIAARMALMQPVDNAYHGGVRTMVFTDLTEAQKWLARM